MQNNLSQEPVARAVLGVEIHGRSAEASDERVHFVRVAKVKRWVFQELPNVLDIARNVRHGLESKPFIHNLLEI